MIEITTWMNGFLKATNETFGDRIWFVGLQGSYGIIYLSNNHLWGRLIIGSVGG